MHGTNYNSVINVHMCHYGVPGHAGSCISGMLAAHENHPLKTRRIKQQNFVQIAHLVVYHTDMLLIVLLQLAGIVCFTCHNEDTLNTGLFLHCFDDWLIRSLYVNNQNTNPSYIQNNGISIN